MSFVVRHRSTLQKSIEKKFPGATLIDVTSKGGEPWVRFSPFFPHGDIPVPFSPGETSMSVEGIWQGLKVFEEADVDPDKLRITTMKGIKRSVRKFGRVLGHRQGLEGEQLLPYAEARRQIYLPSYRWILDNRLQQEIAQLRQLGEKGTVVLLDYEINQDLDNLSRPLSHAGLLLRYLEDRWP